MARAFEIDSTTGDFKITGSTIAIVKDEYELVQRLRARLNTHTGEWILDTSFGVPYLQYIFGKNPNRGVIASTMIAVITGTPGVNYVKDYTIDVDFLTRHISMTFEVVTTFGEITVSVQPSDTLGVMLISIIGPSGPFIG